jgi:hypothetical protein
MTASDRVTESTNKSGNQPCISAADLFHGAPADLFSDKKDMPNVVSNGHLDIAALHFDPSTSDLPMNPKSSLEPLPGVGPGGWNHVVTSPPELPGGPGPVEQSVSPVAPISELPTPTPGTMEPLPGVGSGGWNHVVTSPPELPVGPGLEPSVVPVAPISELPTPTPGTMQPLTGVGGGGTDHLVNPPGDNSTPINLGPERNLQIGFPLAPPNLGPEKYPQTGFPLPPGDPTSPPERPEPIGNPIKPWRDGGGDGGGSGIYNPRVVIKDLLHTGLQIVT